MGGRIWGELTAVTSTDGWKLLKWTFLNPENSESNSLSFHWKDLPTGARMWMAAPMLTLGDGASLLDPKIATAVSCNSEVGGGGGEGNGEVMAGWWLQQESSQPSTEMKRI